jgi:DNA-binding beta-propeller fold protein YncE
MKMLVVFLALSVMTPGLYALASNFAPYYPYSYNTRFEPVPVPVGYVPGRVFNAHTLGLDRDFESLTDIFFDGVGLIYILDGGTSRIIITDTDFNTQRVFHEFTAADGTAITFTGAQGIFVDVCGTIYVADTQSRRLLIANTDGTLRHIILRPDHALQDTAAPFDVNAVLVDREGIIYVVASSINTGILRFNQQGEFLHFWGPNEVPGYGLALANYIRRNFFLTDTQQQFLTAVTPVAVRNFDIDANGFVYTVSPYMSEMSIRGNVRKLNFLGENVLHDRAFFSDFFVNSFPGLGDIRPDFIDVAVDEGGFINLLDRRNGRVYQYTTAGYLITVFGALGDQQGTFDTPSAVVSVGQRLYVTDSRKNLVYEFIPTEYILLYREATLMLAQFELEQSRMLWYEILAQNSNSRAAYLALGRIADAQGDFRLAMDYFLAVGALQDYTLAFTEYRQEMMARHWHWVMLGFAALVALLFFIGHIWGRLSTPKEGNPYTRMESKNLFPLYILTHPTEGFSQFKYRKHQSIPWVIAIVAAFFIGQTLSFFYLGAAFNINHPVDFSLAVTFLQTVGLFIMFVVANWCICSLLDGEGTFLEIVTTTAYALLPFVASIFINIAISQVLTLNEWVFMGMIATLGVVWSSILLFCGMYSIHDYSFTKTLLSIILTVLGMLIMVFIVILFFGLLQQVWSFGISVYRESLTRF